MEMLKKIYHEPNVRIVYSARKDVITTSGHDSKDNWKSDVFFRK